VNLVVLVKPLASELLVKAEAAMRHVRSTDQSETPDVEEISAAAQETIEKRMDRALTVQRFLLVLDAFPAGRIKLPRSPLSAVVSITYLGGDGVSQTLGSSAYRANADGRPSTIEPAYGTSWPATLPVAGAVRVTYDAGHGEDRPAPSCAVQAIKLLIGHWYENREAVVNGTISSQVDLAVEALINSDKIVAEYDQ